MPAGDVQSWFLQWPLRKGAEQYADIDGQLMHRDVVAQAEIARRYRNAGPAKLSERIIATSADAESWQQWYAGGPSRPDLRRIAERAFREFGMTVYPEPNAPQLPATDMWYF